VSQRRWLTLACCAALFGPLGACDGGIAADPMASSAADMLADMAVELDAALPFPEAQRSSIDFIVTEMNFHFPDGIDATAPMTANPCGVSQFTDNTMYAPLTLDGLVVDGFDLDETVSADDAGRCGQVDYAGPDGAQGVDYAFLRVIDMIRPARPGQTVQTVLASAVAQGLVRAGLRATGIDDWETDDDVEILVTHMLDTPLLGTEGAVIGNSSVRADTDPAFQTRIHGAIVDGVLTTEPADLALGHINLLVVRDRVIELRDAVMRARFEVRDDGVIEIDGVLSGWWLNTNMTQVIGQAVQTIGANPGELECVQAQWSDYSSDGIACDGMSMVFKVRAVSGFLTGLQGARDATE
jgi:hypothetical protein